jgi:hypothetical protein
MTLFFHFAEHVKTFFLQVRKFDVLHLKKTGKMEDDEVEHFLKQEILRHCSNTIRDRS